MRYVIRPLGTCNSDAIPRFEENISIWPAALSKVKPKVWKCNTKNEVNDKMRVIARVVVYMLIGLTLIRNAIPGQIGLLLLPTFLGPIDFLALWVG